MLYNLGKLEAHHKVLVKINQKPYPASISILLKSLNSILYQLNAITPFYSKKYLRPHFLLTLASSLISLIINELVFLETGKHPLNHGNNILCSTLTFLKLIRSKVASKYKILIANGANKKTLSTLFLYWLSFYWLYFVFNDLLSYHKEKGLITEETIRMLKEAAFKYKLTCDACIFSREKFEFLPSLIQNCFHSKGSKRHHTFPNKRSPYLYMACYIDAKIYLETFISEFSHFPTWNTIYKLGMTDDFKKAQKEP
jgi:hypothetical protein